ncbi:MAG: hypothetical protein CMK09_05010 [Ponticaulis sp.]|nr:hypothetical protein [Ponticaulis sp.]|tara:strand:+ start:880 stop:1398 length:519 start_codon:yes stop_codon:yes gene_type:complete
MFSGARVLVIGGAAFALSTLGLLAQSEVAAPPVTEYKAKNFSGEWPADWRVDRFDFRDFTIYQVLDGTIAAGTDIEIFAVYDGNSIKDLNLSASSVRRCTVNDMRLTFGRSEASATQSGMSHIVVETGKGEDVRYVHAFSTMLDLSSPPALARWDISLNFGDVPLEALVCPQ